MRQIEVDRFDLQALQRLLDGLGDVGGGKVRAPLPHVGADLGDDHDLVAVAARLHPPADDGFRFAALVAGHPARIDIGRVDGIETGVGETVENVEGGLLVGRPAEHVAAQHQRGDVEIGSTQAAFLQGASPYSVQRRGRSRPAAPYSGIVKVSNHAPRNRRYPTRPACRPLPASGRGCRAPSDATAC